MVVVDLNQSARSNLDGQLEDMVCCSFSRVSRASPTIVPPGLNDGTPPRPGYTDAQPFEKNSRQSGSIQHAHEVLGARQGTLGTGSTTCAKSSIQEPLAQSDERPHPPASVLPL